MRILSVAFGLLLLSTSAPTPAIQAQEAPTARISPVPKARPMFDGKSLDGWSGDAKLWSVKDGVIRGETTPENKANGNTFLIWQGGEQDDFELAMQFRCSSENNSGIQYRSTHIQNDKVRNDWVLNGYQHEIRNSTEFPNVAGFIYGEGIGRGRICLVGEKAVAKSPKEKEVTEQLITQEEFTELFKLDDWNQVRIVAKGNRIQHYLNGKLILDFTDGEEFGLASGVIGLQLHAGVPMWAEFKDIMLTEL